MIVHPRTSRVLMARQWLYEDLRYRIAQEQAQRLETFRQTGLCLHVPERWPKNTIVFHQLGKKAMRALFAMTGEGQAQQAKAEAERAIKKARKNG